MIERWLISGSVPSALALLHIALLRRLECRLVGLTYAVERTISVALAALID